MRLDTNVSKSERGYLSIDDFRGADLRNNSHNLKRAAYMRNLCLQNGQVRKRNGFTQIEKFDGRVNGINEVVVDGQTYVLVYAGKRFYLNSGSGYTDITETGVAEYAVDTDKLTDTNISVFFNKNKTYIIGCGDYLVLGTFGGGIELRRVENNDCTYIPTTTICIPPEEGSLYVEDNEINEESRGIWFIKNSGVFTQVVIDGTEVQWLPQNKYYKRKPAALLSGEVLESPNLLNGYRKNTLFGTDAVNSVYHLDSAVDNDSLTQITLATQDAEGNDLEITLNEGSATDTQRGIEVGDTLSGTITVTAGTEICSTLRLNDSFVGKKVIIGRGIVLYWFAETGYHKNWNRANLVASIIETNTTRLIRIATATRANTLSAYTVNYENVSITLSSESVYTISVVNEVAASSVHIKATLPAKLFTLVDENNIQWGTINHSNGEITFSKATTPIGFEDNISVLFKARSKLYSASDICGCRFGCEFGVNGNSDRLFFSGNKELPNCDFHSESDDPTYFSEDSVSVFGGTSSEISGYARFSDDSQVVLKKYAKGDSTVYVRRGSWQTSTINLGNKNITTKKAVFSLVGNYATEGCISAASVGYLESEPLFLTSNGVFSLRTAADKASEYRYTIERANAIATQLKANSNEDICSLSSADRYYLCVNGKMYIAQKDCSFTENGRKQYEWWIWDNIHATCLGLINQKLVFGTAEGRLCEFGTGYNDEEYQATVSGELAFSDGSAIVEFSESIPLKAYSLVYLKNDVYSKLFEDCTIQENRIKIPPEKAAVLGEQLVYADNVGSSGLAVNTPYSIKNIDIGKGTFQLYLGDNCCVIEEGGFDLCVNVKDRPLYTVGLRFSLDVTANDLCSFSFSKRGSPIEFCSYNGSIASGVISRIVNQKPVIAEWHTPETDFGNDCMLKNLHSVSFAVAEDTRGTLQLLCHGCKYQTSAIINSPIRTELSAPDFSCFTFNGAETKTYYARLRHRAINYAYFVIISEDAEPFILKNMTVEYSFLKKNKGVC